MDSFRSRTSRPGGDAGWLGRLAVVVGVVLGWFAILATITSPAGAATTFTYDEARAAPTTAPVIAVPGGDPLVLALSSAPHLGRGYDDGGNVARTSTRPTEYRSAPQTLPEQPCDGMRVYRVYGPGLGDGEFGRGWSPIDPRSIGPDRYRDVAGLPDNNPGTHLVIGELVDPSAVTEVREALECGPPYCNDKVRPGGLTEFVIPTNRVAVTNRTYVTLSPPY